MHPNSRSMSLAAEPHPLVIIKPSSSPLSARKKSAPLIALRNPINTPSMPAEVARIVAEDNTNTWTHFEDEDSHDRLEGSKNAMNVSSDCVDTMSMSSDGTGEDVWHINEEQRSYYTAQFQAMQPKLTSLIPGSVAKEFFEKSKLPVQELSKIWQLSDVNRDGALSLAEFWTAMHLVVLRRNQIELPNVLPPSLIPTFPTHTIDSTSQYRDLSPSSSLSSQLWANQVNVESPTSSIMSSPGNRPIPANFEFPPINEEKSVSIAHPVPLRMKADDASVFTDTGAFQSMQNKQNLKITDSSGSGLSLLPPHLEIKQPSPVELLIDIEPIASNVAPSSHRSSYKKHHHSLSQSYNVQTLVGEMAPEPPPRLGHSRCSSLDNQLIDFSDDGTIKVSPILPPRPKSSGKLVSPDISDKKSSSKSSLEKSLLKHGSLDRQDLQSSVRLQKERNLVLLRVNRELNQELQEAMEQRIALEIQMEHFQY